jgi:hypothetical protein
MALEDDSGPHVIAIATLESERACARMSSRYSGKMVTGCSVLLDELKGDHTRQIEVRGWISKNSAKGLLLPCTAPRKL